MSLTLPGITISFRRSSGTALIVRKNTLPQPKPCHFVQKLRDAFNGHRHGPYSHLLVSLENTQEYNPPYRLMTLKRGVPPYGLIDLSARAGKPVVVALDLICKKPFEDQFPDYRVGPYLHPGHYKSHPHLVLPPRIDVLPAVIHHGNGRHQSAPRFIMGIIAGGPA